MIDYMACPAQCIGLKLGDTAIGGYPEAPIWPNRKITYRFESKKIVRAQNFSNFKRIWLNFNQPMPRVLCSSPGCPICCKSQWKCK